MNPAATETCGNGKDDECDGLTDCDDPDCQTNIDIDGDGYFALPCGTDCDDADPAVNPGSAEMCANAKDDDCDGRTDCDDTECVSLPVCTLATSYCRRRSVAKFNLRRAGRDRAYMKLCVTQGFCNALVGMVGDPTKAVTATVDACPDVVVTGDALVAKGANTVFKAKSASDQALGYLVKVNCRKLQAIVKLKHADLQACVANPVGVTLAADGTRSLHAKGTFTEVRNADGNLRRLMLISSNLCSNYSRDRILSVIERSTNNACSNVRKNF